MKLTPREPTPEMLQAAARECSDISFNRIAEQGLDGDDMSAIWRAMHDAAPKVEAEPVAWMDDFGNAFPLAANKGAGSWLDEHKRNWKPLYTHPAAPQPAALPERAEEGAPSVADAYAIGATGSPAHDGERLAFEAWVRGHCWVLGATWNGTEYRHEGEGRGWADPQAMMARRMWAAWRDRGALKGKR